MHANHMRDNTTAASSSLSSTGNSNQFRESSPRVTPIKRRYSSSDDGVQSPLTEIGDWTDGDLEPHNLNNPASTAPGIEGQPRAQHALSSRSMSLSTQVGLVSFIGSKKVSLTYLM
jgi:hypothetical protein